MRLSAPLGVELTPENARVLAGPRHAERYEPFLRQSARRLPGGVPRAASPFPGQGGARTVGWGHSWSPSVGRSSDEQSEGREHILVFGDGVRTKDVG